MAGSSVARASAISCQRWSDGVGTANPRLVRRLPDGAGSGLPAGAFQLPNDARLARFIGAAPPAGHGSHRYFVTVHALDTDDIGVPADATPANLGFTMAGHILGRATLIAIGETPAN
ncbi:hypothetical protein [Actinoplanes sp. NPDC026619]|uniref:YbhB/YbcL family Raf kinase inhibitor-like protein n=1 Tax=Actinoplanes sp. NPDC026619 TaxID=3155798 RepID=UPI0033D31782